MQYQLHQFLSVHNYRCWLHPLSPFRLISGRITTIQNPNRASRYDVQQRNISLLLQQSLLSNRNQITNHQRRALNATIQRRSYFFFPTSWKEFELRWLPRFREKRIVYVRLLREKMQIRKMKLKRYYELTRHRFKSTKGYSAVRRMLQWPSTLRQRKSINTIAVWWHQRRDALVRTARRRWKARKLAAQNRILRKTRNYADRIQRSMNRNMVRVATVYDKLWQPKNFTMPTSTTMMKPIVLSEYSESSWFCPSTGRPVTSRDATGRFVNPWLSESTAGVKSLEDIARWQLDRLRRTSLRFLAWCFGSNARLQQASTRAIEKSLNTLSQPDPRVSKYDKNAIVSPNQMKLTWIGHSTCLIQQGSVNILTDPIFSERCSPFQSLPIGVARDIPCGVSISDLPKNIDFCLISHDHYDHLDMDSILLLRLLVRVWVVPLGIKLWLHDTCNISSDQIIELEWWESVKLCRGDDPNDKWELRSHHSANQHPTDPHPALSGNDISSSSSPDELNIWLTCCPAQHWGSRTFLDRNFRLWCSFAIFFSNGSKFYFGGDTALPTNFPLFDQIRDYIGGNIDLAAIPIGAYEPSFYMADSHCNPAEAVQIHQILDVRQSVGIHWGTFALSEEPIDEPPVLLHSASEQAKVKFTTIRQGEAITVESIPHSDSSEAPVLTVTSQI